MNKSIEQVHNEVDLNLDLEQQLVELVVNDSDYQLNDAEWLAINTDDIELFDNDFGFLVEPAPAADEIMDPTPSAGVEETGHMTFSEGGTNFHQINWGQDSSIDHTSLNWENADVDLTAVNSEILPTPIASEPTIDFTDVEDDYHCEECEDDYYDDYDGDGYCWELKVVTTFVKNMTRMVTKAKKILTIVRPTKPKDHRKH